MSAAAPTPTLVDTRFGAFPASDADVIHFPGGVPGFESCARYVLVEAPELQPFTCLQGIDAPNPSFLVIDPRLVVPQYATSLSPSDYRRLDAAEGDPLLYLATVHVASDERATVNARAPIVINPRRMLGIQALPHESAYRHDHPLRVEACGAGLHP